MPFVGQGRGPALGKIRPRVLKTGEKMGLPWDAYYVLTKAEARMTNSKLHPNTGAPDYNVKHGFSDLTADADLDFGDYDIIDVTDITMLGNLILPVTSSTAGNIMIGADRHLHFYMDSVFLGKNSGNYTFTGTGNVGFGQDTMQELTTAASNTAHGHSALKALDSGSNNIGIGKSAGLFLETGSDNVLIGFRANQRGVVSARNVIVGQSAGFGAAEPTNMTDNVIIGNRAGFALPNGTAHKLWIANSDTVTPLIYGEFDTPLLRVQGAFGVRPNGANVIDVSTTDLTLTGIDLTLPATTSTAGNIMVGADRFIHFYGDGAFIGKNAGNYTLTGDHPVGIGEGALASLTDGNDNMAIGYNALNACTEGIANTAVGNNALAACIDGDYNLALGNNSLSLNTGVGRNVALGNEALAASTTASHCVAVGASALLRTVGGADNVAIGSGTGVNNESGTQNVFIGKGAGQGPATPTNLSHCVMVGFAAGAQETNDYRLYIDSSNTTTPLIYGEFDTPLLFFYTPVKQGDAANYFATAADGTVTLHGTARVTKHWHIHAGAFKLPGINPPGASFEGLYYTLDYDRNTEESAYATAMVPFDWDGTTAIELQIDWLHDSVDAGVVVWACEYISVKAGETVAGATTTITQASAGTHTANLLVSTVFVTKLLAANLEAGDDIGVRIFRQAASIPDTLNEDAKVVQVHFHYIKDKLGA